MLTFFAPVFTTFKLVVKNPLKLQSLIKDAACHCVDCLAGETTNAGYMLIPSVSNSCATHVMHSHNTYIFRRWLLPATQSLLVFTKNRKDAVNFTRMAVHILSRGSYKIDASDSDIASSVDSDSSTFAHLFCGVKPLYSNCEPQLTHGAWRPPTVSMRYLPLNIRLPSVPLTSANSLLAAPW